MGNTIRITDSKGNHIATGNHGMACGAYVFQLVGKYSPGFGLLSIKSDETNQKVDQAIEQASPQEAIVIRLLLCNDRFTEEDIPALEKAVEEFPKDFNEAPKKVLQKYLDLLRKVKEFSTKYEGIVMSVIQEENQTTIRS